MAIDQDRSERSLRGFCGNCKLRRLPRHATDLPSDFLAPSGSVQAANLGSDWILSHAA